MFPDLNALLAPALAHRLTLLINHVLSSEPVATRRLLAHQGRVLRMEVDGWPRLLPPLPVLAFRITPAGLLEWQPEGTDADLRVRTEARDPARVALAALGGEWPAMAIEGDAQLAADVDWLLKNLRWDVEADLERLFGPALAHQLHRLGAGLARALRASLQGVGDLAGRMRGV